MDREKCDKNVHITIKMEIKPHHYERIMQENITAHNDNLITGIYQFLLLQEETYIVCCIRGKNTLDYTKFAGSQKQAYVLYEEMLKEIEKDLEK